MMPTVEVQAELSVETLLKAAEQLSSDQLDRFARQVVALRGRRVGPCLSHDETALLLEINRGVPAGTQARFDELSRRRDSQSLTHEEHQELLQLTDDIERWDARRLEVLAELARSRGMSLNELMQQLEIAPDSNGQ